jgi:hypothetical protein
MKKIKATVIPPKGYCITKNPKYIDTLVLIADNYEPNIICWVDASIDREDNPNIECLYIYADKKKDVRK